MDRSEAPRLAALLRHHRSRAGLTQQQLARRVGYSRSTVANAEGGDVRSADFYRRCDEALGSGGVLEAARRESVVEPLGRVPAAEAIEHLRQHWHLLVRTDNLLGPGAALPAALAHLGTLTALLPGSAGPSRTALLCLSARYALTVSWLHQDALHQDAGSPADAAVWAGRALEWAHECDDRASVAWALHRRSRLAEGDPERALSLAGAAVRAGTDAARPLAAALRVQCARAYALAGDERRCEAELSVAERVAEFRETAADGRTGYGGYCTRGWVLAVRGECALRLGSPADAVRPLRSASALIAPAYHRDRGRVRGLLAEAQARLGEDPGEALRECRAVGEATGSASVLAQAGRVSAPHATSAA